MNHMRLNTNPIKTKSSLQTSITKYNTEEMFRLNDGTDLMEDDASIIIESARMCPSKLRFQAGIQDYSAPKFIHELNNPMSSTIKKKSLKGDQTYRKNTIRKQKEN